VSSEQFNSMGWRTARTMAITATPDVASQPSTTRGGTMRISVKVAPGVRISGRIGSHHHKRRKRKKTPYWYHGTCTIHHRTQDAANRCTNRAVAATAVTKPAVTHQTAPAVRAPHPLSLKRFYGIRINVWVITFPISMPLLLAWWTIGKPTQFVVRRLRPAARPAEAPLVDPHAGLGEVRFAE
jgi:hypothetical protein